MTFPSQFDTELASGILKRRYPTEKIEEMVYRTNAAWALMPKNKSMSGNPWRSVLRYGTPQQASMAAAYAFDPTYASSSSYGYFDVTPSHIYGAAQLTGQVIRQTRDNAGALVKAITSEMNGAIMTCARVAAIGAYGNHGGAIGIVSAVSGGVITLATVSDITNFDGRGMYVQSSTADGTSGAVASGYGTITARNAGTGQFTYTANGGWSPSVGDYLFRLGGFGASLYGFKSWIPITAPTSGDSFFGQDRSLDVTRMAGQRVTASVGQPIEETLQDLAAVIGREGGIPDYCFMNNIDVSTLKKSLGTKMVIINEKTKIPNVSFTAVVIDGDKGPIKVIADQNCPQGYAWMVQLDTWELASMGAVPELQTDADGLSWLRMPNVDSYQARIVGYCQPICFAPGFNGVATL